MKPCIPAVAIWFAVASLSAIRAQEMPQFPGPETEHQWLKQFVGEWEAKSEARMGGPDQSLMQCQGTMTSRMLGEFWVVSELTNNMGDMTMTGIQTLGYDREKKKYVGTWVDSMTSNLWKYEGTVDESGKTLTLEAEGPNCMSGGKMTKFRDAYEFKSKDHIVATSSMQNEDGKWVVFMTGNLRRAK